MLAHPSLWLMSTVQCWQCNGQRSEGQRAPQKAIRDVSLPNENSTFHDVQKGLPGLLRQKGCILGSMAATAGDNAAVAADHQTAHSCIIAMTCPSLLQPRKRYVRRSS